MTYSQRRLTKCKDIKKSSFCKCKMKIFYDIISINEVKSFDNCNMNQFFVFVLRYHRIIPQWKLIYHQALFANSAIHRNNLFEKFYLILFHKHSMCHLGLLAINQPHAVLDRDRNILIADNNCLSIKRLPIDLTNLKLYFKFYTLQRYKKIFILQSQNEDFLTMFIFAL